MSQPAEYPIPIDPSGDLHLTATDADDSELFLISSTTLTSASSFFTRLLAPTFSEGVNFQQYKAQCTSPFPLNVHLEQGTLESVTWLFRALHDPHTNPEVSLDPAPEGEALSEIFNRLHDLAVVVDYFDCGSVVSAMSDAWTPNLKSCKFYPPDNNQRLVEEMLYASYILQNERVFRYATKHCSQACYRDVEGKFILWDKLAAEYIPAKLLDAIEKHALGIGKGIVKLVLDVYHLYENARKEDFDDDKFPKYDPKSGQLDTRLCQSRFEDYRWSCVVLSTGALHHAQKRMRAKEWEVAEIIPSAEKEGVYSGIDQLADVIITGNSSTELSRFQFMDGAELDHWCCSPIGGQSDDQRGKNLGVRCLELFDEAGFGLADV